MNLFICGSKRKQNCYSILKDLTDDNDRLITLGDKNIKYCLGCNSCEKEFENYCVIEDDMKEIYSNVLNTEKIIIATPIYFNHITGLLKNVIDRLNPFCNHELLKNKKIYLITIGAMSEEENLDVVENIKGYFKELEDIFGFKFIFLKNFTSSIDGSIYKNYGNYEEIVKQLKKIIEQ